MFFSTIKSAQYKFKNDLKWNIAGFLLVAICGLSINILITRYYSFAILGYFNILLVFFLVLSQISSWGIQLSVQKFIPQFSKNIILCKQILTSSFLISMLFAAIGVFFLVWFRELPGKLMGNDLLTEGFIYMVFGIGFLTINKISLSFLNGMRMMKSYAFYSSARPFLMLLFLLVFIAFKIDIVFLGLIFTIPEFFLTILLLFKIRKWFTLLTYSRFKRLFKLQFWYGNKVVMGSVLTNFQSKIDIFILGFFVTDTMLGVYSFAVFIADGFFQIFYVFRTTLNPVITNIYYNRSLPLLRRVIDKSIISFYKIFLILGLIVAVFYPVLLFVFKIESYFFTNLILFYILLLGILIASGYLPFQFIFNQIGKPKEQTKFLLILFCLTIIFNLSLIPLIGVYGAATGIFLANIFQLYYLRQGISKNINSTI